jgi:Uma2 family endonuclease
VRREAVQTALSASEYLASERGGSRKHEYSRGETFAMAGASRAHNLIVTNLVRELSTALRGQPCEVYPSDMRVRVASADLYTYPDVVVVCSPPEFEDEHSDTLQNPTLLVEVLSDGTEAYDRGKKFEIYRSIPSLSEYVLVSQDEPLIERYCRQTGGVWALTEGRSTGSITLLGKCTLSVQEIFLKVFDGA